MFLHTRLKVRDMERSIAFYTEQLGFTVRDRSTSPRGTQLTFLGMAGTPTELELAFMPWDPDFTVPEDLYHLAFKVEDMLPTLTKMRAAGVKITEEASERSNGGHMAFIEDPDGHEIELLPGPGL